MSADAKNDIPIKQNAEEQLSLLKARQWLFKIATRLQILQLLLTVLVPLLGGAVALFFPDARPFVALCALVILISDIAVIDRWQRAYIRRASIASEVFDSAVLELPWNSFLVGEIPSPELIGAAKEQYDKAGLPLEDIVDWYPVAVGRAPIAAARLSCQRANVWYDAELRRTYSNLVIALAAFLFCLWCFAGLFSGATFSDMALLFVPLAPVVVWSIREHFRHKDAASAQELLMKHIDALLTKENVASLSQQELLIRSREIQDAIFQRRVASPLIFPFVYKFKRQSLESAMNIGADERITKLGY